MSRDRDGAKYAPRGGLRREQLEPLVESGATVLEIAQALDRAKSTVRYWLRKHELRPAGRRGRRPTVGRDVVQAAIARGERTVTAKCGLHGFTTFVIEKSGRARCRKCRLERVAARRRQVKATLVAEAGGACALCGYNRCLAALTFHHLDPSRKEFALSVRGVTRAMDKLRQEAAKCVLLCANCHAEVEGSVTSVPLE